MIGQNGLGASSHRIEKLFGNPASRALLRFSCQLSRNIEATLLCTFWYIFESIFSSIQYVPNHDPKGTRLPHFS